MSTDILRGVGSIRTPDDKGLVGTISYQLWEKPATEHTPGEWWGTFTLDRLIEPGEYIVELEDVRKGTCYISGRIKWMRGLPTVYHHNIQGSGPLM